MDWLTTMPLVPLAILVIGGGMVIALLVVLLLRHILIRYVDETHLYVHVVGYASATAGVLYAVLLGFIIISAWEQFGHGRDLVDQESAAVLSIFRMAHGIPQPMRGDINRSLLTYTRAVVDDEYPAMAHGQESPAVDASLSRLYANFESVRSNNPELGSLDTESIRELNTLSEDRAQRLALSRDGLSGTFWFVLIFGAIIMVAYVFLFSVSKLWAQLTVTGVTAAVVASMIFLLLALDHPFAGDYHVSTESFRQVMEYMLRHAKF